jgi:hypothetical protein
VRARLDPGGLMLVNVGHPPGSASLERVLTATMRTVFRYVRRDRFDPSNTWLIASTTKIEPGAVSAAAPHLPGLLRPLARTVSARIKQPLSGGTPYTDDRAPVEWLVDQSLLGYAAHHGQR